MDMKVQIKQIIFTATILLMSCSFVFADEDRHVTVDREVGGMEQGSRIGSPGSAPTSAQKTISSSQGTKKAGPDSGQAITAQENHGNIYVNPEQATGSTESPTAPASNPIDTGAGAPVIHEPSMESGGGSDTTAPIGSSSNPIVDADVNVNPDSGTVEVGVTVDTTGELEEKQILDADLAAEGVTSVESDVRSAADLTGSEVVESADLTTSGQTSQTSGSTTSSTQESSTSSSNPIVSADANVNPGSGAVEGGATVDTSGELEEKQILDADVAAGETVAPTTEVGSATDITQSDIIESADITTQPVQTVTPIPSDLTAEVDTTGATTGSEADVGIEADVSGLSEGEDVTCDPADGLLSSSACADLKL